jgi:hypothetical protein
MIAGRWHRPGGVRRDLFIAYSDQRREAKANQGVNIGLDITQDPPSILPLTLPPGLFHSPGGALPMCLFALACQRAETHGTRLSYSKGARRRRTGSRGRAVARSKGPDLSRAP